MKLVESWQDHYDNLWAIVSYSQAEQKKEGKKRFEVMSVWRKPRHTGCQCECACCRGPVLAKNDDEAAADFDTIEAARDGLIDEVFWSENLVARMNRN